jgi:hypothetical protein
MRRSWVLVVGCPSRIRTSVHGSKVRCPTTRRRGSGAFGKGCGAEDGTRTRDPHLGKVMLYQLSHFRSELDHPGRWCRGPGSNWRHRDFQSRALPTELPRPDGEPRWVPPRRFAGYHGPFGARHGRLERHGSVPLGATGVRSGSGLMAPPGSGQVLRPRSGPLDGTGRGHGVLSRAGSLPAPRTSQPRPGRRAFLTDDHHASARHQSHKEVSPIMHDRPVRSSTTPPDDPLGDRMSGTVGLTLGW